MLRSGARDCRPLSLMDFPDLLTWPFPRPLGGHNRIGGARIFGRLNLDQVVDLETIRAQQADPISMVEVKVDRPIGPLDAVHPEVGPLQALRGRGLRIRVNWRAGYQENTVDQKHQIAAGSQEPRSFGDPE